MLTRSTKLCLNFFAAGHLLLLLQCGVNLPPKSQHSQSGPHQGYYSGQELAPTTADAPQTSPKTPEQDEDEEKKKSP